MIDDDLAAEFQQICEIAREVRLEFEIGTTDVDILSDLYRGYAVVGDIAAFLRKAMVLFPAGNGSLASLYLQSVLGGEVRRGWYKSENHTFLVLEEKIVVDITADQHGGPPVYVGPLRYPYTIGREKGGTV